MKFREYINESNIRVDKEKYPEMFDFLTKAEKSFKKHFPNGFFFGDAGKGIGVGGGITLGLIGDGKDVSNGIRENDPLHTSIHLWSKNQKDFLEKVEMEMSISGLSMNPEEGSYMAMGRVKTQMRKSTNTLPKLQKTLDTYFTRLAKIVKDNITDIYHVDNINKKYLKIK